VLPKDTALFSNSLVSANCCIKIQFCCSRALYLHSS